jgi:hypothetical protein
MALDPGSRNAATASRLSLSTPVAMQPSADGDVGSDVRDIIEQVKH